MYINHEKYALVNGVMLDGTRDMTPRTGLAVCVDGDRIAAVCDAADVPEGYARVDLGGKYLLPGLINLHVHLPASGKPRKKPSAPQAASAAPKPSQVRYSKGNPRNNSLAFVIIAIVFLLIFVLAKGGLLHKTIRDHEFREDNDWSDIDWDDSNWSDTDWDSESTTPAVHYRDIDADCGDIIDISDDLALQILGYVSGDNGQVYVLYWASDNDLAKALLESGSLLLWSDTGGFACPPDEIGDGYIYFSTYSPDTRWQTLTISDCTAGNITIRSLLPHEGTDIPDYNISTTAYPA